MPSANINYEGHILDSLLLTKVLDLIVASGAQYEILDITIGKTNVDHSTARIKINAADETSLADVLKLAEEHGAVVEQRS